MSQSETKKFGFSLDEVSHRRSYTLGIVTALRECDYEEITSAKLDTRRSSSKAGKVLSSLNEEGYLNELKKGGAGATYKISNPQEENLFDGVVESVKESYREEILGLLEDLDAEAVYDSLLGDSPGFDISETNDGWLELPKYINDDYSRDSLILLDDIGIIKGRNVDPVTGSETWDREVIGDQEDIDYVLEVLGDERP